MREKERERKREREKEREREREKEREREINKTDITLTNVIADVSLAVLSVRLIDTVSSSSPLDTP